MRNKLEELRKEKGLTQEQLSTELKITSDYVSMIERGARSPGFKLAKKIADFFSRTVDEIFFDNEQNETFEKQ